MAEGYEPRPISDGNVTDLNSLITRFPQNYASDCNSLPTTFPVIVLHDANTLNTPYKQGLTNSSLGFVISSVASNNYGTQLCITLGDAGRIYLRDRIPSGWRTWKTIYSQ